MTDIFPEIGNVLDCYTAPVSRPGAPIRNIQLDVCRKYGFTLEDLLSEKRAPKLTKARHEAIHRADAETNKSPSEIARAFHRDPSTIWWVLRK